MNLFDKEKVADVAEDSQYSLTSSSYISSLFYLANTYQDQGLYAKAEPLLIEMKEQWMLLERLEKESSLLISADAFYLELLTRLYARQGWYAEVDTFLIKIKEIRARLVNADAYASSLKEVFESSTAIFSYNLAKIYHDQGLYAKAAPLYVEAREIFIKINGGFQPASFHLDHARLYNSMGNYSAAEPLYTENKDFVLKKLFNNFSNLSEGEKKQFFDANFSSFEGFHAFIATIVQKEPTYQNLPHLLQNAFDLQLQIKGALLAESQKMKKRILSSGDKQLIEQFEFWKILKNRIAQAYNTPMAERAAKGLDLPKLEIAVNDLEKQLSVRSQDFKEALTTPTVIHQDIQKQLKEGEVAVEMIRTKYANQETKKEDIVYLALVLTPKALFPVLLKNGEDLEGKILKKYRNNMKFKMIDTASYRAFWQPIAEKLAGAKKVYFSPDGAYNSLNINTLLNPTTKKYVVEEYDISILTNLKEVVAEKKSNVSKKATLFGRPAYAMSKTEYEDNSKGVERGGASDLNSNFSITQMGFSDLVGTEVEVKGIDLVLRKNTWQTELILGKQALEERVKQVKNPAILHIATHGYFIPSDGKNVVNAMLNSGIVLAGVSSEKGANSEDGVLTAYEASSLDLDETDLVVLSACETGLGEVAAGEGVYGLQRGFKIAGAKAVVMSLWKVDDTATQELMNTFYELWLSGKPKREAFKTAQLKIKEKYKFPYYWGAFVMVGD